MKRILFTWELGANLGHLTRDLPLVQACLRAGHEVYAAVSDLRAAAQVYGTTEVRLLPAPALTKPRNATSPINYADILLHHGFGDKDALNGALAAWRVIFDLVRPDLLVYNHAPTALLAARVHGVPTLLLGNAFEIPPPTSPTPAFRMWEPLPPHALENAERQATDAINAYLTRNGKEPIASVGRLFDPYPKHIAALPEVDFYGPRDDAYYVGPIYALPPAATMAWPDQSRRRKVFAYLRPEVPNCESILAALNAIDATTVCVVPGMPAAWSARYRSLNLRTTPVAFQEWLADMDLVVTYGTGTIQTALLGGTPVVATPQVVEQYLTGSAIERLGAGRVLSGRRNPSECQKMLLQVLEAPGYRQRARALAARHSAFDVTRAAEIMLRQCGVL